MRLKATEKLEVIRLVEDSELSVRRTLAELGVGRSTFYGWYRRYVEQGEVGLQAKKPGGTAVLEPDSTGCAGAGGGSGLGRP